MRLSMIVNDSAAPEIKLYFLKYFLFFNNNSENSFQK